MPRAVFAVRPSMTLALLAMSMVSPAWALYKVVGPDGRVTYTDRAPSDVPAQSLKSNGSVASTEGLPYELQRVVSRYPVTLYTGSNCNPCDAARQLLKGRGVPFVEKTIGTSDDIKALSRLEGTDQLPVGRIGQKQLLGFNQADWSSYVDAAGYPAKSALPLNYRWPAAAPLSPSTDAKTTAQPGADKGATGEPSRANGEGAAAPTPSGPAPKGFRF